MIWKSKKDCFISLLICMGPWTYLFHNIAGLHNLKSEPFQVGMGFSFPWPILSCIDTQSEMYCRIPIILCGRPRVIRWRYNNFVLSDTKPNDHIKTHKQIVITKWERKYCQIRETETRYKACSYWGESDWFSNLGH